MELTDQLFEKNLRAIASGDQRAFRRFYDYFYPTLYRFARYFLPFGNDCDEVVSEVFCLLWQSRHHLVQIQNIESYLYIVCRNECWRCLKQKEKFRHITSIDDMPVALSIQAAYAEESLLEKEMFELYKKAVEQLPERCKLIFLMVREEHLKHKEIARILNITEGTIEQQMNIAIRKILAVVKQYDPSLDIRYGFKTKRSV